eukprot:1158965-Pelagomonas_calceolata.AAC.6
MDGCVAAFWMCLQVGVRALSINVHRSAPAALSGTDLQLQEGTINLLCALSITMRKAASAALPKTNLHLKGACSMHLNSNCT